MALSHADMPATLIRERLEQHTRLGLASRRKVQATQLYRRALVTRAVGQMHGAGPEALQMQILQRQTGAGTGQRNQVSRLVLAVEGEVPQSQTGDRRQVKQ